MVEAIIEVNKGRLAVIYKINCELSGINAVKIAAAKTI
jgi:hypothetical protein